MDVFEGIRTRRTMKGFTRAPLEFDKVSLVIEAGTHAPSPGNLQNWKFIVVTKKDVIRDMHNYCLDQVWINEAQVLIVVCALPDKAALKYGVRGERLYTIQSIGACVENMLLAAKAQDLGAAWIGAFDEDKIKVMFDIPDNVRPQAIIALGYSDYKPMEKIMQPIQSQVYFNSYGQTIQNMDLVLKDYNVQLKNLGAQASEKIDQATNSAAKFLKERFEEFKKNVKDLLELK